MDHSTIKDQNVILLYIQGRLDAEEAERFEEHYLDCPECLEALELSRRLEDGLKGIAAEETARVTLLAALSGWWQRQGRLAQTALAAVFAAVVVLPWLILPPRISQLSHDLERATAPQVNPPAWRLSPERSAGVNEEPSAQILVGETPEWFTLSLDLPPQAGIGTLRVRVLGQDGTPLWRSGPLEGLETGQLEVSLHSSWLEAGRYDLEVEALPEGEGSPGAVVGSYSFRVVGVSGGAPVEVRN